MSGSGQNLHDLGPLPNESKKLSLHFRQIRIVNLHTECFTALVGVERVDMVVDQDLKLDLKLLLVDVSHLPATSV